MAPAPLHMEWCVSVLEYTIMKPEDKSGEHGKKGKFDKQGKYGVFCHVIPVYFVGMEFKYVL